MTYANDNKNYIAYNDIYHQMNDLQSHIAYTYKQVIEKLEDSNFKEQLEYDLMYAFYRADHKNDEICGDSTEVIEYFEKNYNKYYR